MQDYSLAIREGLRSFRRERTLSMAMIGCVAIAVFAIGAFALLALNINFQLKRWESRVELVAFLSHDLGEEETRQLVDRVASVPEVGNARLVSSRDSWKELFAGVDESLSLDRVHLEEVLPPSIVINLGQGERDLGMIRQVARRVASFEGVDEVKFEELLLERYLQLRRDITLVTIGTSVFGVLIFGIITVNIARLASTARRSEVHTLQLLGASTRFIRRVFMVAGLAQGVSGAVLGIAALIAAIVLLSSRIGEGTLEVPARLFVTAFAVGPALGLLASRFSARTAFSVSAAILLALLPAPGLAQTGNTLEGEVLQYQKQLRQLEEELQQSRVTAEELEKREIAIIDELERTEREMDSLTQEIRTTEANIEANNEAIEKVQADLARYENMYAQSRKELEQWLRLLCNRREPTIVEVVLYDIPQSQITRRREMVALLAQREAEALEQAERLRAAVLEQQAGLRNRLVLDTLYTETGKLRAQQAAEKRKQREALLAGLREQKGIYLAAIKDLEVSARNLQEMIAEQRTTREPVPADSVPFREMKGLLPWPADGEITVPFGRVRNPDSNTYIRHYGIDISAAAGTEIRAIHEGAVAYSDWFRGYGKLVILEHGAEYNSVYAHCSELLVQKGTFVKAGQPIAFVGETGSLKGPFLYFEIREHGQPVDPVEWLQRRSIHATQPQ
jgi:septal ring factor EnvC (AmiA/AmiB activator)